MFQASPCLSLSLSLFVCILPAFFNCFGTLVTFPVNRKKTGGEFTSFPSIDKGNRKQEHTVRLMMRQKKSTPTKSKSTFRAKAISDIVAPEPDFKMEVAQIAPAVTPSPPQDFSMGRRLDFSVFKSGNFMSRLSRAGAKSGFITVSLMWDNYNDLDLHCTGPNREEIFYNNRKGKIGELDVDMNAANQRSREPVENLYFPQRVSGRYKVHVNHYSNKGDRDPTRFVVLVRVEEETHEIQWPDKHGQPKQEIYAVNIR